MLTSCLLWISYGMSTFRVFYFFEFHKRKFIYFKLNIEFYRVHICIFRCNIIKSYNFYVYFYRYFCLLYFLNTKSFFKKGQFISWHSFCIISNSLSSLTDLLYSNQISQNRNRNYFRIRGISFEQFNKHPNLKLNSQVHRFGFFGAFLFHFSL